MNNKNLWVAIAIVGAIAVVVLVLTTGGPSGGGPADPSGDVSVSDGDSAPTDTTLADIVAASVTKDGEDLVFEAKLGDEIPRRIPNGSLELRWDISQDGDDTWIVSANLNVGPTAALTSQKTNYGSSTIDDSMPGSIEIDGDTLIVVVKAAEVDDFPTLFNWTLKSTLDADRADPSSGVASDTAPDSGLGKVE